MRSKLGRYMNNLEHFATVVEYKSISCAASVLGISQPALTRSIIKLEDVLNVKLLNRSVKGVDATEYGYDLLRHISGVSMILNKAYDDIRVRRGDIEGRINCGAGVLPLNKILPYVISETKKRFKKININIIDGKTIDLLRKLRANELDIVVGIEQDESSVKDLFSERIMEEKFGFFVSNSHDAIKKFKSIDDILKYEKMVMPSLDASPVKKHFSDLIYEKNFDFNLEWVETMSIALIKHLMISEDYIAFGSDVFFEEELNNNEFKRIDIDLDMPTFYTCIFRRKGEFHSKHMDYFIEDLKRISKAKYS